MLELHSIYKQFGGNQVLRDVSIALDNTTSITGLIGPNGSGKSTLFQVVMGFYSQDSGKDPVQRPICSTLCLPKNAATPAYPVPFRTAGC